MSLAQLNQYRLKLSPTLISQLLVVGVTPDDLVEFIDAQFHTMITCKPNCRMHQTQDKPIWILRGYYPGTPVFFKLTVVKVTGLDHHSGYKFIDNFSYYVRARELKVNDSKNWKKTLRVQYGEIVLMSEDIAKNVSACMENTLLGATHQIPKLIVGGPKIPKCMSPKGMKLYRFEKPLMRGKRET